MSLPPPLSPSSFFILHSRNSFHAPSLSSPLSSSSSSSSSSSFSFVFAPTTDPSGARSQPGGGPLPEGQRGLGRGEQQRRAGRRGPGPRWRLLREVGLLVRVCVREWWLSHMTQRLSHGPHWWTFWPLAQFPVGFRPRPPPPTHPPAFAFKPPPPPSSRLCHSRPPTEFDQKYHAVTH